MIMDDKEVAIIGMGPGGVSAAIYLKRYGMVPYCFEKENVGGKTNKTDRIANYPGFIDGHGPELAMQLENQLSSFDIKPIYREVKSISLNEDGSFHVDWKKDSRDFRYVILANGLAEKEYDIPGQETFHKRGISRCAICDGPFYKGKKVAVIGGGNSAFEEAIYLASICEEVSVISHHSRMKVMLAVLEHFKALPNAKLYVPYETVSCTGNSQIESLIIRNGETGEEVTLDISGLFLYIGDKADHPFLSIDGLCDEKGYFITDSSLMTKQKNLYAIGDCRETPLRQVTMAVADGSLAATAIHDDYQSR